jgi:hypothetical protein
LGLESGPFCPELIIGVGVAANHVADLNNERRIDQRDPVDNPVEDWLNWLSPRMTNVNSFLGALRAGFAVTACASESARSDIMPSLIVVMPNPLCERVVR